MSTQFKTGKVRLGYVSIFEPRSNGDEQEAKYQLMVIIDKEDKATLTALKNAVEAAKEVGKEKVAKWKGKVPGGLRLPLRDGDQDKPDSPELAGKYFMNAKSSRKPQVVKIENGQLVAVTDPADVYSGCYGKVSVNLYGYSFSGNNGIGVGLNNVLFLEDGDPLSGGGVSAITDFADEVEGQETTEDWMG